MRLLTLVATLTALLISTSAYATFPGENGKIVFQQGGTFDQPGTGIVIMNPDGSGQSLLVSNPDIVSNVPSQYQSGGYAPRWSADGSEIVMGWHWGWELLNSQLRIIRSDGSVLTVILHNDAAHELPPPMGSFSPDGTQVVFFQQPGFPQQLSKINVDGGSQEVTRDATLLVSELTLPPCPSCNGAFVVESPVWSPDGSKILFNVNWPWHDGIRQLSYSDLFTVNADGTNLVQLTHNSPVAETIVYERSPDWSPDGTKFVFVRSTHSFDFSSNTFSIIIADADGSNRVEVLGPTNQSVGDPVWSPDGTKILFDGGNPILLPQVPVTGALYVMDADGSNLMQLTPNATSNFDARFWPSWQPLPQAIVSTGTNVAVNAPFTIGVGATILTFSSVTQQGHVNVETSNQGPPPPSGFRNGLYYEINNTASFSGSVVACFPWNEGQFYFEEDVEVFQYENGVWTNITTSVNGATNEACGQTTSLSLFALFEPQVVFQNGKIAFETAPGGISVMNPDGTGETVLTSGSDHEPVWFADGSKIVVHRNGSLAILNADGTDVITIPGSGGAPRPSPDGSQIVYQDSSQIYRVDVATGRKVRLTTLNCWTEEPSYSPDGTKIAFDGGCDWSDGLASGSYGNIYVMNSGGSNVTQITNNTAVPNMYVWNWGADWYPDGTKLLFNRSVHTLDYATSEYSIVTCNSDGSNQVIVAGPTSQILTEAMWSPDGTKIVMDGGARFGGGSPWPPDATGVLYVMNADGTNLIQISDNSAFRFHPDWQPIPVQSSNFTDTGNDVPVQPVDPTTGTTPATITFSSVTEAGETTLTSAASGPTPPAGFKVGEPAVYYDVSTTAGFGGMVTLCFTWTEGQFENENNIALFHYESGAWQNVTTSLDTNANQVCGQTSSLSPFAIFETSYTFAGFFAPVDNPPTRNSVKAGSAIPVKFSLGGNHGLSIFDAGYPASQTVQCDTSAPLSAIEETVSAGGSSLSYDAASNQYSYIWKTNKSWANSCRRLVLKFNDGTIRSADFSFNK